LITINRLNLATNVHRSQAQKFVFRNKRSS